MFPRKVSRRVLRYTAFAMLASLMACSLPAPVIGAGLRDTVTFSNTVAYHAEAAFASWVKFFASRRATGNGMPQRPATDEGIKPSRPLPRADKEAAVSSIQVNPAGDVVLQSGQPMLFAAIPLDAEGSAVQGLLPEWTSTNPQVLFMNGNGEAVAGRTGTAILTATAGHVRESVRVTVVEGNGEEFGGKKKQNSRRNAGQKLARASEPKRKRAHTTGGLRSNTAATSVAASAPMFLRAINDDPLPDAETGSLFSPNNGVGQPPGRTSPGAPTPSTAADGTESPGSSNFSFDIPVVNLPGRGIDLSVNLFYNSRAYNKSTDPFDGSTWMTYDVDSGWPAEGFRLGFGQIEDQASFGFTLTDPNGTRHLLVQTSTTTTRKTAPSFISRAALVGALCSTPTVRGSTTALRAVVFAATRPRSSIATEITC